MTDHRNKREADRLYSLKKTEIKIKETVYPVSDISAEGIGLVIGDQTVEFFLGQRIDCIPIALESGTKHLKGTVAHISRNRDAQICGIQFRFNDKKEFDWVAAFKKERSLV